MTRGVRDEDPMCDTVALEEQPDEDSKVTRLLEVVGTTAPRPSPRKIEGVLVATFVGVSPAGEPLVDFTDNPHGGPLAARSAVTLGDRDIGRAVAVTFEAGDPTRPFVLGPMATPAAPARVEVEADGERVEVRAREQIVLSCGKASITLTAAGKVLISGEYVLTRSAGLNRIQGGSVRIN